jgi:hypothetical protein
MAVKIEDTSTFLIFLLRVDLIEMTDSATSYFRWTNNGRINCPITIRREPLAQMAIR